MCKSQQVIIKGNAKSYAGDVLYWQKYSDLISNTEEIIAKCKVAKNGDFEFKFNTNETISTFIDLDVFQVFLYVEPGKEYRIVLPKKTKKLPEDKLNPFFEPYNYYVRILNSTGNELTKQIEEFDNLYTSNLQKSLKQNSVLSKSVIDSVIHNIKKETGNSDNQFFNDYKTYSYASLKFMAYKQNKEQLIKQYIYNKPVLYNNPAYINLFKQLFDNHLSYLAKNDKGKKIPYYLIRYRSLSGVKSVMDSVDYLSNDTLQEVVICKSLYDNFYNEDFPQKSIIAVIDSVKQHGVNAENRIIAGNILNKITHLLVGYEAPDFKLYNQYRQKYTLKKIKGSFVYLNFVNPNSYTCLQQLEVLKTMYEKEYDKLKIVSVFVCDDIKTMRAFVKEHKYKWDFLHCPNNDILKKYKVRVFPTYYMINPEGKLVMSPAFPPTENSFEARYYDILKAWKRKR